MTTILDFFDVTIPLQVITWWCRRQKGHAAKVAAVGYWICTGIFGWLSWYFDIDTTMQWSEKISSSMLKTLSQGALVYAPLILIAVTVFPTAIRQTMSRASKERFTVGATMVFVLALFDVRTDWPRVKDFFDNIYDLFDVFGPLQGVVWMVCRVIGLFMATDGFEILFVVCLTASVMLTINSLKGVSKDDD